MDYIELDCQVQPPEPWAEILIAGLADMGFESFAEYPEGFRAYIMASDYDPEAVRLFMTEWEGRGPEKLSHHTRIMGGQNWNAVWESRFEPVLIRDACLIRAPFHETVPGVMYDIVIEPKMSFGTGHHETTSLAVELMLEMDLEGRAVLDMGCGTGVLGILAAKMGAHRVTAIDNYVYAYENTIENAERNGLKQIRVLHGDASLLGDETFEVIIANITRNVLLDDMRHYVKVLQPGGVLMLSGFLSFDKDAIFAEASRLGLDPDAERKLGDWVALRLKNTLSDG